MSLYAHYVDRIGRKSQRLRFCSKVSLYAHYVDRIGRKSQRLVRAAALKLAQELLEMVKRPWMVAMVTRCQEG